MIKTLHKRLINRKSPARLHLIGVAGSGMSGLALMLMEMGHRVSGCDRVTSTETERLQSLGLAFSCPHSADAVADAEIVIYSSAIREDNPALAAARQLNIPCMRRAECLAAILNGKKGVVVSGTHGKTTTSALCAHLMREGRMRPCHYVGAEIPVLGTNAHWNEDSEYLVAEGDESDGTLVNYIPEHSIVLNVEPEHLDHYKDLDEIKTVFHQLCTQTRGKIIYCKAHPGAADVCGRFPNAVSYGWSDADYTAADVVERRGRTLFTVFKGTEELGRGELGIPGRHNVLNALAAIALATELGVDFPSVTRGLASFAGAKRRFETKYLSPSIRIVDDYGHHPTEIAATLQTARSLQPERLVVYFQPHRYTRTQMLAEDFGKVLQAADLVFVADVYPASELPIEGISGQTIIDAMHRHGGVETRYLPDLNTAHHAIGNALKPGDLFLTLGAGNVHECGMRIARDLALLEDLERTAGESLNGTLYEPMSRHTTMGVGGCAQFWLEPSTFAAMQTAVNYCRDRNIPVHVVGRGSNIIVRDGGLRGAVIHPSGGEFDTLEIRDNFITAGAGVRLKKMVSAALRSGLGGLEWMDGIPGNVGGSLRMNAGAMGRDMIRNLVSVTCLDEDGEIRSHPSSDLNAQYRSIPDLAHNFVLQAVFEGSPCAKEEIEEKLENARAKRRLSQPSGASAGCIFKNPEEIPAGKLIDELGLKNACVGDACVSSVHANFIINRGHARARDITILIDMIRKEAMENRGIDLKSEAQVIGDREPQF